MRALAIIILAALLPAAAWADSFRIHYSIRGSGCAITVQAESSYEARRLIMDLFPGAVITNVHRIRKG